MTAGDRVKIVVRSRKVPARVIEFQRPILLSSGLAVQSTERRLVYESILDDSQREALEEARRLSRDLGLELEVVDTAKANSIWRTLSRFFSPRRSAPSLILTKSWPSHSSDVSSRNTGAGAPT